MQIDFKDNVFIWSGRFEERQVPYSAGFGWENARWETADPRKVLVMQNCSVTEETEKELIRFRLNLQMSHAKDSWLDVPVPEKLALLPFQKAGVEYLLHHDKCILGDEMRLGKTVQAVGLMNICPEIQKVLVICPCSLKINWDREIAKWSTRKNIAIRIINYDVIHKYEEALKLQEWDLVIFDEAHYLKNKKAKRTEVALSIPAKRLLFMTGTPVPNRPIELFPILEKLDPEKWEGREFNYAKRYCRAFRDQYGKWNYKGASNLDELQDYLRSKFMVRRLKKDVIAQLPEKRRQVIELPGKSDNSEIKEWKCRAERIAELRKAIKEKHEGTSYEALVKELKVETDIAFTKMSKLRHDTAIAKLPQALQHIEDMLDDVPKIIVFAYHRDVIEKTHAHFKNKSVILYGGMSGESKEDAIRRFQTCDSCQVFIGQINAAGVGISLAAANVAVFVESDWVPGTIDQAENRMELIGKKESLLIQHLVLAGSLDAIMAKAVVNKQENINKALDFQSTVDWQEVLINQR